MFDYLSLFYYNALNMPPNAEQLIQNFQFLATSRELQLIGTAMFGFAGAIAVPTWHLIRRAMLPQSYKDYASTISETIRKRNSEMKRFDPRDRGRSKRAVRILKALRHDVLHGIAPHIAEKKYRV